MTKHVGIVVGHCSETATSLKAAILALDPSLVVTLEPVQLPEKSEDPKIHLGDKKIAVFDAVERLSDAGAQVIAFSCPCVHEFLSEVQTETTRRLIDPCDDAEQPLAEADYAKKVVSSCFEALPKPFKVGMIGGLGPAATVDLYDKIVKATPARFDQEHFKLVVEQNPQIPDRTACLLDGGADPTLALYHCAKRLQKDECDVLIIPCNTAHAFVPYLERHLDIPFINMQQTTMDEIQEKFGETARIGLLATSGTVKTGVYAQKAEKMGLKMFVPDEVHQKKVMDAIYGPLGAKAGYTDGQCKEDLLSAVEYMVETYGCNVLILGCTELPLILKEGDFEFNGKPYFIIDPTSALARKVAKVACDTNRSRGTR